MSYREFFDSDIIPLVRTMTDRARRAGPEDEQRQREVRAMIWQALGSLGATRPVPLCEGAELAELLGSVLYQGPLMDTVTAAELSRDHGHAVALAVRAHGADNPARPAPMTISPTGPGERRTISARRAFVGFASEVDYLMVVGDNLHETVAAVVPAEHDTVTMRRYEETGRGELYEVTFADTPVTRWCDGSGWARVLAGARVRQAGYLVGLAQGALDLAVGYAKQRKQFGRPIGQFQALSFRLAELAVRTDATRVLVQAAARDGDLNRDHRLPAAQCLAAAAELALMVTTAGMQIHGATGMLDDNDAQLFYRRAAVEAGWLGTAAQLRAEAAPLLAADSTRI